MLCWAEASASERTLWRSGRAGRLAGAGTGSGAAKSIIAAARRAERRASELRMAVSEGVLEEVALEGFVPGVYSTDVNRAVVCKRIL